MKWILDTKLLLRKRELDYKFHYCPISQDMYWPCGTPRSTSGGKQLNRWRIQMYLYKRAVEWSMDTLESYFWDFHNYQDLQYMYLSLRLKTFVKMDSWLSKFAFLLKAGTCKNFYGRFCFSALFWQKIVTKKIFTRRLGRLTQTKLQPLFAQWTFNPYQLDVSISKLRGFWCIFFIFN